MQKLKVNSEYFMTVPEWFMNNRCNGVSSRSEKDNCWIASEIYDYSFMRRFMTQFTKDSIFLDVGAQMGLSTLPIASSGYAVVAVEPVENNLLLLNKNIVDNKFDKVVIVPFAAHCKEMEMDMYVPEEEDCASLSREAADRIKKPVSVQKIKAVVLDNHLPTIVDVTKIKFIKIDVQGAEIDVIRGLSNTLSQKTERYIFMEWDSSYMKNYGYDSEELLALLKSLGYKKYHGPMSNMIPPGDTLFTNKS